jgi:glycosyltransferase involved in cell wall biosynthesis
MRVCIISPRHVSYNPRVVKEADCLADVGYEVTVVAICNHPVLARLDEELMASKNWSLITVDSRRQGKTWLFWLLMALRQKVCLIISRWCRVGWIIERATCRQGPELSRLASMVQADQYLAHHAEALPIACRAARYYKGKLGFDAEDFHTGMDGKSVPSYLWEGKRPEENLVKSIVLWHESQPQCTSGRNVEWLEDNYLSECDFLTAASPLIGMAYAIKYNLAHKSVVVIDNVFPLASEEELLEPHKEADSIRTVRLYWYSQIIGPGRGLETAVAALKNLPIEVELHLRGDVSIDFSKRLRLIAKDIKVENRIHFHPVVPPQALVSESARFDIGLALELDVETNRLLCLTNKIFTYLNAGLPVVATSTPAQADLAQNLGDVCVLCKPNDSESLAKSIMVILQRRNQFGTKVLRYEARKLAMEKYSWQKAEVKLLKIIRESLRSDKTYRNRCPSI